MGWEVFEMVARTIYTAHFVVQAWNTVRCVHLGSPHSTETHTFRLTSVRQLFGREFIRFAVRAVLMRAHRRFVRVEAMAQCTHKLPKPPNIMALYIYLFSACAPPSLQSTARSLWWRVRSNVSPRINSEFCLTKQTDGLWFFFSLFYCNFTGPLLAFFHLHFYLAKVKWYFNTTFNTGILFGTSFIFLSAAINLICNIFLRFITNHISGLLSLSLSLSFAMASELRKWPRCAAYEPAITYITSPIVGANAAIWLNGKYAR